MSGARFVPLQLQPPIRPGQPPRRRPYNLFRCHAPAPRPTRSTGCALDGAWENGALSQHIFCKIASKPCASHYTLQGPAATSFLYVDEFTRGFSSHFFPGKAENLKQENSVCTRNCKNHRQEKRASAGIFFKFKDLALSGVCKIS